MSSNQQRQKAVLITGASKGIGRQYAYLFGSKGHNLVLTARSADLLLESKTEIENMYGANVMVIAADLAKPDVPKEILRQLDELNIDIDILINNAGFGDYSAFLDSDLPKQLEMVDLNVRALTEMAYLFGNKMKESGGGKILNIASIASVSPGPYMAVYFASKAYVLSLSQALYEELKPHKIKVTALCPGPVTTHFESTANLKGNSKMFKRMKPAKADRVALIGYKALMKGKAVKFYGKPRLLDFFTRFVPRSLVRKIVKSVNGVPKRNLDNKK